MMRCSGVCGVGALVDAMQALAVAAVVEAQDRDIDDGDVISKNTVADIVKRNRANP